MISKALRKSTLILFGLISAFASTSQNLELADSLFTQKKYTQANEIFESIYHSDQISPAMLLKMAYIQEGLENPAQALIYLNEYYALTANKKVLDKMRTIAEEYELVGYEYSDIEFFLNLTDRYKIQILGVLMAISVMLLALIYNNRNKGYKRPDLVFAQVFVAVLLFLSTNGFYSSDKAIIDRDQTLLMSGPSAGAEPIEMLSRGHRIIFFEENDAWVKVQWYDRTGYIRKNRIHII